MNEYEAETVGAVGAVEAVEAVEAVDNAEDELICQVCNKNVALGVACGACGPISFAYCRECLQLGAEPFGALVAYLGCGGTTSREMVNPDYFGVIDATVKRAGKTEVEFWAACVEVSKDVPEDE